MELTMLVEIRDREWQREKGEKVSKQKDCKPINEQIYRYSWAVWVCLYDRVGVKVKKLLVHDIIFSPLVSVTPLHHSKWRHQCQQMKGMQVIFIHIYTSYIQWSNRVESSRRTMVIIDNVIIWRERKGMAENGTEGFSIYIYVYI